MYVCVSVVHASVDSYLCPSVTLCVSECKWSRALESIMRISTCLMRRLSPKDLNREPSSKGVNSRECSSASMCVCVCECVSVHDTLKWSFKDCCSISPHRLISHTNDPINDTFPICLRVCLPFYVCWCVFVCVCKQATCLHCVCVCVATLPLNTV